MEYSKLPVAKRTRWGSDRYIEERFKRFKSSGAVVPVPEALVVSPVKHVVLDEDDDEGFSGDERGKSVKSRKFRGESKKGRKLDKDCDLCDNDVIVVDDIDDQEVLDDSLSEGDGSDVVVVSVIDKGKGKEIERTVNDKHDGFVKEDGLDLFDSLSTDCGESSDDSYKGDGSLGYDHAENLNDSSSYAKSEDEGNNDPDDDYETESRIEEKNNVKRKRKGKLVEGRGSKGDRGKKETVDDIIKDKVETFEQGESSSCNDESDNEDGKRFCNSDDKTDEEIGSSKYETSVGRKNRKRIVKSAYMKRTQNAAVHLRSNSLVDSRSEKASSRKDGLQIHSVAETDDESSGKYANRYGGGRGKCLKRATRRKPDKDLDAEQIICDSLAGIKDSLKKIGKEQIKHKFWFSDMKPVEKSKFDEELDQLFADLNTSLTCEDIGSTPQASINLTSL